MRKRRSSNESNGIGGTWITTYGDMVTLLLCFFVLLYTFSTIDADKWDRLSSALRGGKGVLLNDSEVQEQIQQDIELMEELQKFQMLYSNIKEYVESNDLQEDILITKTDNEIRMRFTNNVLFDSGRAILKEEAYPILNEIASGIMQFKDSVQMIRIEGHTDNLAISTPEFPSNWELSTARAVNVLRYLIEEKDIPPNIISAVGYGEHHPFADNSTEEGRIKNRRVDFVIARTNQKT